VPVFFAFRIMVGIGLLMIAAGWAGLVLWLRGQLFETRWYLWLVAHAWWIGFVAVICGWIVTETGRQPWVVEGILRTPDATSPHSAAGVAATFALFVIVYGIIFGFGIYYMNRLMPMPALLNAGSRRRTSSFYGQYRSLPPRWPASRGARSNVARNCPHSSQLLGCSCSVISGLRSQAIRISCRPYSRSRKPPRRPRAKCSCSSERWYFSRWSSVTSSWCIGCFVASCAKVRALTEDGD
jgi:hypothetical protein